MCNAEKPNYKKMKVLIFAVLVVSLTIGKKTFSQVYFPFPDSNAAWNTVGHNIFSGYQWNFRYAVYGDTVINSIEYHKVYEMFDSTIINPYSTYFAAIRENQNRQVFCLIPGFDETILYDFNLEIGDTIWYNIGGYLCENNVAFEEQTHFKIVSELDSILLENNQYRKSWSFEGEFFMWDNWVEGIGSLEFYGLLNPLISDMTLCGDFYQFACFKHNDTALFLDNPNCERCFCNLITEIEDYEKIGSRHFELIPNPATSKVVVKINDKNNLNHKINIYNITGELVITKNTKNIETEIKTANFKNGLYFIQIFDSKNKTLGTEKLIIE